jgi:hypothetical protein
MSVKYNILVPDDLHINQKNFPSFFKFINRSASTVKIIKDRRDWITLYGNYESKVPELNEKARVLACLPEEALFNYKVRGVNIFMISRAEILSRVASEKEWHEVICPESLREVFDKLLKKNKSILMLCLAAAWDWLDFWSKTLADEKSFTHCCIFSGSLIYQRSLIELLRYTPTKVMVMESVFTGNDYYCEEKYEPIANNCEIRHRAVYESLATKKLSAYDIDRERIKAINKIILAKNKNVEQPDFGEEINFPNTGMVVTILGQVVNDFSLLEYEGKGLSSICFYKEIIDELVENGFNVIFKAHPWERKKINIRTSFTRDVIDAHVSEYSELRKSHVKIVDDYPIERLFSISDFVIGLNSQSLIEAAFHGLKPLQFGNAFFGGKGFTNDYSLKDCKYFVDDIIKCKINGSLSLKEYENLEEFLRRFFQEKLVSVYDSGVSKLESIFELFLPIALAKKSQKKKLAATPSLPEGVLLKKSSQLSSDVDVNLKINVGFENKSPAEDHVGVRRMTLRNRKIRKLFNNPRKFFSDSKNTIIRSFRFFFKFN